jgi:hypothetical protein
MNEQTSKGMKITLLIYGIYAALYGLIHIISPELVGAKDPAIERVLGALVLAFALGALLAYVQKVWAKARIAVLMQIAWSVLYMLTMAWGLLTGGIAAEAWAPTIIAAIFAALLIFFYQRQARS